MEFKTYGEIDLDDTPIAVLGCGHFFTGETLDGLVGMGSVYTTDNLGSYNGLKELSGELTPIPCCPDCRVPIRQFATRRYNRVVNKAVLDETSKRFLVGGRERLAELEKQVAEAETALSHSRDSTAPGKLDFSKATADRYNSAMKLDKETARLRKEMTAEHQPTRKLFDAIKTFQRLEHEQATLEQRVNTLHISASKGVTLNQPTIQQPVYDQQITLNAHRLQLRIQEAMLRDAFTLLSKCKDPLVANNIPGGRPDKRSTRFLQQCRDLIASATEAKLPRLVIPTILSYARIAQLEDWYRHAVVGATATIGGGTEPATNQTKPDQQAKEEKDTSETARRLLNDALALCDSFPGGKDYRGEVEETMKLFAETRYEEVTPAEIAAIKSAMVSGTGGFATHAGHWYTCRNDHPVSSYCCPFVNGLPCGWGTSVERGYFEQMLTRWPFTVCHRGVRHAHGAGQMSGMWRDYWRAEPYGDGWNAEGYADGEGLTAVLMRCVRVVCICGLLRCNLVALLMAQRLPDHQTR
jgi:hypothetical protein